MAGLCCFLSGFLISFFLVNKHTHTHMHTHTHAHTHTSTHTHKHTHTHTHMHTHTYTHKHTCTPPHCLEQDYFAWNNSGKKLFHGIMPPFIRGKSKCTQSYGCC